MLNKAVCALLGLLKMLKWGLAGEWQGLMAWGGMELAGLGLGLWWKWVEDEVFYSPKA